MTLLEQRENLLKERRQVAEQKRLQKLDKLVKRIETVMRDPEVVSVLEQQLLDTGMVQLSEFGCLCEQSFCEWQKGLSVRLQPLFDEWQAKGVKIRTSTDLKMTLGSPRTHFNLTGKNLAYYFKQQNKSLPTHLSLKEA